MRVTQQMLHQNSVRHINQNLSRFEKTNNQVATGKLMERPSDNPTGVSKAMNLKSTLAANEQYERNIDEAALWLDETDQTISNIVNVMQRVRELAVEGSSGTASPSDRAVMASEVEQLALQIEQFSSAQVNGQQLFGAAKNFTIGDNVSLKVNESAAEVLGDTLATLEEVAASIKSGTSVPLEKVDSNIDQMLFVQTDVGARTNRMEATQNRLKDGMVELQSMLSKIEDVDYAEAVIRLKSEESVYQASLASSAKIIQPSLLDFLR